MAVSDVIVSLEQAVGPDRQLDVAVARAVGFTRSVRADGQVEWTHPGFKGGGLPGFTASLDAAYTLVHVVVPKSAGGVSWVDDNEFTAIVNGGGYARGATPAIAICIAALRWLE